MPEVITSRTNPLMARIRKLNESRAFRRSEGRFCCEGPKLLAEALAWGAPIKTVVAAQGVLLPDLPPSVRMVTAPSDLLDAISDTKTPQGVVFTCEIPALSPPERLIPGRYLVLDGLQDPGNVGAIWRTADGLGGDGLLLLPHCADPFAPKTIRATMGACFRLPVWEVGLPQLQRLLAGAALPLCATALRVDAADLRAGLPRQGAVVVGSEGSGISAPVLECCDIALTIPMRPRCESLNAAVAASVVLWEWARGDETKLL